MKGLGVQMVDAQVIRFFLAQFRRADSTKRSAPSGPRQALLPSLVEQGNDIWPISFNSTWKLVASAEGNDGSTDGRDRTPMREQALGYRREDSDGLCAMDPGVRLAWCQAQWCQPLGRRAGQCPASQSERGLEPLRAPSR
jgi:hypothetical protein